MHGFDDLAAEREGKLTLRTHQVEAEPLEPATGEEIQAVRKKLPTFTG